MTTILTIETFLPYLHTRFTVPMQDGSQYELELVEVKDDGPAALPEFRRPFSLFFTHPRADAYLPQRIYLLNHAVLGALELFLVPHGPRNGLMEYQCVFN